MGGEGGEDGFHVEQDGAHDVVGFEDVADAEHTMAEEDFELHLACKTVEDRLVDAVICEPGSLIWQGV